LLRQQVTGAQEKETGQAGTAGGKTFALLGAATGGLGAAVAAFFAALCCVGPSTVALFGVGGALAAASLKPYRPFFLVASLAMILYGFWRVYGASVRNRQGQACPTRIGRFSRGALWLAAIVWVAAAVLFKG
jgi:mercuric ion transport protein